MKKTIKIFSIVTFFLQISLVVAEECSNFTSEYDCATRWYCHWKESDSGNSDYSECKEGWLLNINSDNDSLDVIANTNITAGLCNNCLDGFNHIGEDEPLIPAGYNHAKYVILKFTNYEWESQTDGNGMDFSMDKKSESYRMAEDVILGRGEFCQNYISAWRGGKLDVGQ